jgi:hypothetical protein
MNLNENAPTSIVEMKKQNKPTIKLVNPNNPEDVEIVPVDVKLNLKKLMFIARDFPEANSVATLNINEGGMTMDMIQLYKLVYVAYRMANMNEYYTFDQFQDLYEFDMNEANEIYFSMLNKQYRTAYLEKIQKASDKVASTVKSDNSKLES